MAATATKSRNGTASGFGGRLAGIPISTVLNKTKKGPKGKKKGAKTPMAKNAKQVNGVEVVDLSIRTYEIRWVKRSLLKPAAYNPTDRTKGLRALAQSIKEKKMIIPIVVDPSMNIIAGHRRWAATGPEYMIVKDGLVPVLIVGYKDARKIRQAEEFREEYSHSKALNGRANLEIFLKDKSGNALSTRAFNSLNEMANMMGRPYVQAAFKKGYSGDIWHHSRKIVRYLKQSDDPTQHPVLLKRVAKWLLKHGNYRQVGRNCKKVSPTRLTNAINSDKFLPINDAG
jgi:hypothetical protein